jgi:GNAT superfamily N-acetyltransferase
MSVAIKTMCTLSEYQGKGLGSLLLERILRDVDRDNARVYLQASEMGARLYIRFRFVAFEDIVVNTPTGSHVWQMYDDGTTRSQKLRGR